MMVCWGARSKCKGAGKAKTDSYANHVFDLTGRAQGVTSKGHADQGVSQVGVCDMLVWDAAVLLPTAPYVEPSYEWFHEEQKEEGRVL
eukprot:1051540-Pelagomonas_calceolata.AAC.1